jgi:hypothetical protein
VALGAQTHGSKGWGCLAYPPPTDHTAMPRSGPRGTLFLLLPPLLLLRAVLAVPLERGAPSKEENPATESPVSGPALLSCGCLQWYNSYSSQSPWGLGYSRDSLSHDCALLFTCHSLVYEGCDLVKN